MSSDLLGWGGIAVFAGLMLIIILLLGYIVLNVTRIRADEKGLSMQYEARTPLPDLVRGDERKLKQAQLNLLTNAVKYTHRGGITLRELCYGRSWDISL